MQGYVSIDDLKVNFDTITEPNLRKTIRIYGGREDELNKKIYYFCQDTKNENIQFQT